MDQATHKSLYNTHGWIGIISGILLFIVIFSGIPSLFEDELDYWQSPSFTQLPKNQQFDLQAVVDVARVEGFIFDNFFVSPANEVRSHHILWHFNEKTEDFETLYLAAHNNALVQPGDSDIAHILAHLHTDLHLPSPFGRYLVGIAGMAMLLAIIAGIILHTKWKKEFITLRPKRSWRLLLTDHHKILGLWTLPFTFILAFTGTILGLLGLISPILALAAFTGDVEKATEAVLGPSPVITGIPHEVRSLNTLYDQFKTEMPNVKVHTISLMGYGDEGGLVNFSGNHESALSSLQAKTYSLHSGETVHTANFMGNGPFQRIFAAVVPLHYVLFGGGWLKLFYAISALAVCGLIVSGNLLWLERRGYSKQHWLGKLTLGVCGGLVVATFSLFASSVWMSPLGEEQHHAEELLFWLVWIAAVITPFVRPVAPFGYCHNVLRISLALIGATLLGDGLMNDRWLWNSEGWVLLIQFGLLLFAALIVAISVILPHPKPELSTSSAINAAEV